MTPKKNPTVERVVKRGSVCVSDHQSWKSEGKRRPAIQSCGKFAQGPQCSCKPQGVRTAELAELGKIHLKESMHFWKEMDFYSRCSEKLLKCFYLYLFNFENFAFYFWKSVIIQWKGKVIKRTDLSYLSLLPILSPLFRIRVRGMVGGWGRCGDGGKCVCTYLLFFSDSGVCSYGHFPLLVVGHTSPLHVQ